MSSSGLICGLDPDLKQVRIYAVPSQTSPELRHNSWSHDRIDLTMLARTSATQPRRLISATQSRRLTSATQLRRLISTTQPRQTNVTQRLTSLTQARRLSSAVQTPRPLTYYSAWFCPFAHRATLALEHHSAAVPYTWEESLGWEQRPPSGEEDFAAEERSDWWYRAPLCASNHERLSATGGSSAGARLSLCHAVDVLSPSSRAAPNSDWKSPGLLAANPLGMVPTLLDEESGKVVHESLVCIEVRSAPPTRRPPLHVGAPPDLSVVARRPCAAPVSQRSSSTSLPLSAEVPRRPCCLPARLIARARGSRRSERRSRRAVAITRSRLYLPVPTILNKAW